MEQIKKLFFILACFGAATAYTATPNTKATDLQQINSQIQSVQQAISHKQLQETHLQEQLQTTEIALAGLQQDMLHINHEHINEQKKLETLKSQQQTLRLKLVKQQNALALQVQAAYKLGKLNEFKIILNQEDANVMSRHLGYYRYLVESQQKLVNTVQQTLKSLQESESDIAQHQKNLQNLLQQKQTQKQQLTGTQALRQKLISQLNQDVQSKETQLATLQANQNALKNTIEHLQTDTSHINAHLPFNLLRGKLQWPVKGKMLAQFGSSLDVGDQHLPGVIIKAPLGSLVHSIAPGKVLFADWLRGFGLLVIVDHGNGYMSLYARNQTINVKAGDKVNTDTVVASTGNTGGYEISSLYFEIRENGIPVNPNIWCR